ncbi:MAG: nucleoside triphosphate pyrophosphatase [Kofleriaceae bacterium]
MVVAPLILASASPRRRELLERVGVEIEVVPAGVDETPHAGEDPLAYVARIAAAKAATIAVQHPGRWVLAADTTVTIDGAILGKAETGGEATAMLRQLAGRTHQVITGFAVAGPRALVETVTSDVDVIALGDGTIAEYVASGEWRGKAGAYAIQGIAAAFVRGVRGSVTNIIGLPLAEVLEALRALGAPGARVAAGVPS